MKPQRRPGRRLSLKRALVALLVLYLSGILLAAVSIPPDRLILVPTTRPIHLAGESRRFIPSPTGQLEIWTELTPAARNIPTPRGYVLAFNGNGSRAEREVERIVPMWSQIPVEIWAMNYPGYGASTGPARLKSIPPAALAAYDALAKIAHGTPIFLSGHSLGTTVALGLAARRPIAGLVLHNPPPLRQLILGRFGWFNLWILADHVASAVPPEMDSLANAAHCPEPALFLLAEKDTMVPPKYQQMVVAAYAGPKRLVHLSGYAHNDPVRSSPALGEVQEGIDWLWQSAARQNHQAASRPSPAAR